MYTLRMLGGISLTDDGGVEVDALLRQPKHVALLAYLSSPKPGTWHKRDSVLGTFWPEHDQARSRSALRSALYTLRGHLPDNMIRARGDNDLSIDPQLVSTDTARMSSLLDEGDYAHALACYTGEFLPGIYIPDAEGFDQWLEHERRRTLNLARSAARHLSERLEADGDLAGSIHAARRNYELDPADEATARRLIALLDASGDRAQAFALYEEFRNHVYEAFGVRPSAETVALLDAIRTRHEPGKTSAASLSAVTTAPRAAEARPDAHQSAIPKRRIAPVLVISVIFIALAGIAWTMRPREQPAAIGPGKTMVVLPVSNDTGDPSLDYLATGIGDDIARRLGDASGFTIRSGARSIWPGQMRADLRGISSAYGASLLLRAAVKKMGDSLELDVSVIDAATLQESAVVTRPFSQSSIADVESKVAADIAGAVFSRPLPVPQAHPVDTASYRLTLQALHQLLTNVRISRGQPRQPTGPAAKELFQRAVNIDRTNARAWAGLSSVWASDIVTEQIPFDDGYDRASAAAKRALALDSGQGAALANLAILEALKYRTLSRGETLMRNAEAAEPSNPEVYLVKSVMYRNAHMWNESRDAIRFARTLDPLAAWYMDREAVVEFCAGRPEQALALYRKESALDPTDGIVQGGITRALVMLHRYDEALDSWRTDARLQSDTIALKLLEDARGKEGYWGVRHTFGRERLKAINKRRDSGSPKTRMQLYFAAGDSARGFQALDELIEQKLRAMYRLPCMPDVDEFRETNRFKAAVAKAGALPK